MGKEYRTVLLTDIRSEETEGKRIVRGNPILYNSEIALFDDVREVVAPGASSKTLAEDDIRAVWNHNTDIVLGRKSSGTLRLAENDQGVEVEIEFPDSEEGRNKFESVRRKDVIGMSYAFIPREVEWSKEVREGKLVYLRKIVDHRLFEVSPCTFPANERTSISARSRDELLKEFPDMPDEQEEQEDRGSIPETLRLRQELNEKEDPYELSHA